jgi:hypothetical protein
MPEAGSEGNTTAIYTQAAAGDFRIIAHRWAWRDEERDGEIGGVAASFRSRMILRSGARIRLDYLAIQVPG